ncbi:cardiac-enriched FHL2-interacting protein isoform X1 [Embiotoca jacksoni]|uniref:cardiac-enriched FHL2-interacting protein isoform X1 n=1 Tax=Embiotoca jacksoni TaxID=100190 RepID=UPI003704725B
MTSVEKRRSSRKSGGHRKHSDGGYSDTSSGGSFLDENDREVSNLTDRAFRSLCIGDEAVYNDSDLCLSSPCTQRDRQLAFSQGGQDREDREREELKRAAHENFSLRLQQYGQDWIHGGMYGAEIHRDPQWEVYGERTQGRVSATFQHSFVETSQQEKSLREEQLSFLRNGATELNSQQRRSRSRVSSLIRAFNSEGQRDGAGMDDKLREWSDETSWDKSALMSIQRELSEFSTSYQQNFNNSHYPSIGPFSSRDTNFYSSEVAAVAHMSHNSATTLMSSSHSKHSMSTQVNCNSNFFIHSEFSPFKVWRDHNRFPFQRGEVSGFMHCSEFPKWYETPMYKELSLEDQPQGPYRGNRYPRGNLAPVVPPTPARSTSTSTMQQRASAVEKRCESELAGHYPHRKRAQSLGANRLHSQRPSTASPTIEMSRRVRDTISSVKALQQKIKMMTHTTGVIENQQGVLGMSDNSISLSNNAGTVAPNVVSRSTRTTPFNISQLLTPLVPAHQEAETADSQQHGVSPLPVEHPPVRAESRGATPDIRMSSYKSRATSLLFNLKDNRKRVKSTYSPTKFKGLETLEKNKQPHFQDPRETVIDIPDFPAPDIQFPQQEESSRTNAAVNQYHSSGLPLQMKNSQSATGQYPEYTFSDRQTVQMQGQMVHHSGFTGFISGNYISNQLANGQNLQEDLASFAPNKQGVIDHVGSLEGDVYRLKPSYTATDTPRLNADNNQSREHFMSGANTEQAFNETAGRVFTKVDRYEPLKDNKHDYNNVSSKDKWRQTNSQDTERFSLKAALSPWKQETDAFMEKMRQEHLPSINKELEKIEMRESFGVGTSHKKAGLVNTNTSNQVPQSSFSHDSVENPAYSGQQPPLGFRDDNVLKKYSVNNEENKMKDHYLTQNYNRYADQEYTGQHAFHPIEDKHMAVQETSQGKQYMQIPKRHEMQSLQPPEGKPQFEYNIQKNSSSNLDNTSAPTMTKQMKDRQFVEVKADQAMAEHMKAQHAQTEMAKAQQWAQVEQPNAESSALILAGQSGSEKVQTEWAKSEPAQQEKVKQEKAEQIREKQAERVREERTKVEQTRVQKATDEPRNITEEAGGKHMREEQCKQVKAEQAETERLKEEHINTKLAKGEQAGQAGIMQRKTEQGTGKRIHAEEQRINAEQVERGKMEAEQFRTEKVNAEQAEAEQTKTEHMKEQETKAEQVKTEEVEVEKVKTDHIKVVDVRQTKDEEDSIHVGRVNPEQSTTQRSAGKDPKPEERKAERAKLEKNKVERELTKTENMQERSAKLSAKLTATLQVKSEPDKVEQVKIELAKAKAELAKIKEKMRGEQKQKVRQTVIIKDDDSAKKSVPLSLNVYKNEDDKKQHQAAQMHQQKEDTAVRNGSGHTDRGADDFYSLRGKYGFINTVSINRNNVSTSGNISSNDGNETQVSSLDKPKTISNDKSKDQHSPTYKFTTAGTETKKEVGSLKSSKVAESQYVYNESSKEFKLSSANYCPTNADKRGNGDTVTDKVKNDSVEKVENCDLEKDAGVSEQKDFNLAKLERKPKSAEHSVGPGKDLHVTPPKTLSHKERAQTKQEILTSKIKAHAEKEISAIKEKGFAMRDGIIGKSSTKQLAGSQSVSIRQRPPSQEVSKKHESTMSSNITPKHQMEISGVQMEPVKSVSPPSSATVPVTSAVTAIQIAEDLKKEATKKPLKSKGDVAEPARQTKQTESYTVSTTEGLVQNQKQENQHGIKSPMQNKEQAPKIDQEKQQANCAEMSGKQKAKDNPAINTDILNRKKKDPSRATGVEPASSKHVTTEKAESKEAANEHSSPSIILGQKETPVVDDSLQIMGIMVTVRERKPSVSIGQWNNNTQNQINATEKESSNSELGNTSSKEAKIVQETEDEATVVVKNHPENVQETSTSETRKNDVTVNVTEKRTNLQQEGSTINAKPQRETQPEPLAEKGVTVTVPAQNKAETQPLLNKHKITARGMKDYGDRTPKEKSAKTEEKNQQKMQTAHTNENFNAKVVNTGISKHDAETLMKHNVQPSEREDMTHDINQSKGNNTDSKKAPPLKDRRHDSTPAFNKASPSNSLTENKNRHVSPKHQYDVTNIEENTQGDDNVHIDSIAVRVVAAVTERDNVKMSGKHHVTALPAHGVQTNEHEQAASSSFAANTLNCEDRTKDLTPASSEKRMTDSLKNKLGVQQVLSSVRKLSDSLKMSNQQNSINAASDSTQAENDKVKKKVVDESNTQPVEGDYFQVQGATETSSVQHNNSATVEDTSKGGELPGILPNKSAISNDSNEDGKNEAFVFTLDQCKRKTMDSSSVSIQDENVKRKNWEDKLASKQTDGPMEKWSNNKKLEPGQADHIRKHHTENPSSLSAMESPRNSHPTMESTSKGKPEVKPKERVSTIPEISALADYARLKVIASEDREVNTVQEFPPNKKEGFFPLIQTRHSRRPVFTADPEELAVKEKSLPNTKTEMTAKVNKEPKAPVFPITEKEHQRTGMFKLGDKDRQDKMLLDAKVNEGVSDDVTKCANHTESKKSPTPQREQMAGAATQRKSQGAQSICKPNDPPLQATTSSSVVNRPSNASEGLTYVDKNSPSHPPMGQMPENQRKEPLATQHEETKAMKQGRMAQLEEARAYRSEEEKREGAKRIKHMLEESKASLAEEERRAIQREEERRARERQAIAIKLKERRDKQKEAERRADEDRKAKQREEGVAQKGELMRAKQRAEEMRMKETEERQKLKMQTWANLRGEEEQKKEIEEKRAKKQEDKRAAQEQQRRVAQGEEQRRAAQEEQQRKAAQEEQQRRAAQEEQRRAAQEKQQRRAVVEEQQRKAAQEEQQRKAVEEEQQRRAAQEEQRRAAQEKQQRRAVVEEQQRKAAQEEQQKKAVEEEQQRRAAQEEQQRRAAQEEQQMRAVEEEQQRRAAQEEQQRKAAQEEQQRRAAQEEQQRRAAQEEQQRRVAQEEQQRRAVEEEQQRRAAQEEQQRRAVEEEQQRKAAQEEQQRKAVEEEQQRRAAQEEQQRRAVEEEQRRVALIEEQRRAKQTEERVLADIEGEKKMNLQEQEKATHISEEERKKHIQGQIKIERQTKEQRRERQKREEWTRAQRVEEEKKAFEKEKTLKQREEKQAKEERARLLKESQAALKEEKRVTQEQMLAQREDGVQAKKREEEEKLAAHREKTDALQYYAITSTESERKPRERQLCSPLPSQQRNNPSGLESADDTRPYRPHAPASPAPSLPRSNTSSPALGFKPSMFRVKDNTIRGSSLTKSVKPRFHKNFGEDFRFGSPMDRGSERGDEEPEIMRRSAGTPVNPDTGLNRLAAINESSAFHPSSSQEYSAHIPYHRPYSRKSFALEEDDSRSVISNMSEDVESFATSVADLTDLRGLYDSERPESACSFSSDVSRSLGKPPAVPPKSEKALRRAKRLTTRRIKKELSKPEGDTPAGVQTEVSSIPSSSIEVCSSNRHAVASPHFSPPVSLAHAPTLGPSLPSSHRSFHASPHATGPISLPVSSPYATAAVPLPAVSPHATGHASHHTAPKTVAYVPSSPTLHRAKHPAPVTQYQVESSYPQAYPLTQRKVLQDLGSGQYFVVDVPVQVMTKTFFDPETGKYVQLNVRESGQSISQPQPQHTCPQPQVQPQMQIKPQQQPHSQASPAGKPVGFYQGHHPQPAPLNSMHPHRSSAPGTAHQDQQADRESHSYGHPALETGQNSEGHRYSPEKTPYMDTVKDTDKTYNAVYSTHGSYESFPECDTNSQLAESSGCENDNSAHSGYQPRDIITISELEDFMEMSDW